MPICQVKGVGIHYLEAGVRVQGKPNIVFIHGATSHGQKWAHQLDAIADIAYGAALDLPGHGRSEGNPCDQVFLYREWVKEFVSALDLANPIIAGHSMGGAIAMDYALKYPEQVQGLVLVGTAPQFQVAAGFLEELRQGKFDEKRARSGYSASTPAEFIDKMIEESKAVDPWVRYTDYSACSHFAVGDLGEIKVPTLIICGVEDISTPPQASRYLADHISDARLVLVERAAHNVMVEQPQKVNQALVDFLQRF
jgi:pimeloyl-ACP methyl ester carboxylesterase